MKALLAIVAAVGAALGLRSLARRSNTQIHRINQQNRGVDTP